MHLKDGIASEPMLLKVFLIVIVLILSIIFVPTVNFVKSLDTNTSNDYVNNSNNSSINNSNNSSIQNNSKKEEINKEIYLCKTEIKYKSQIDYGLLSKKTGLPINDIILVDSDNNQLYDSVGSISSNFSKNFSELDINIKQISHASIFTDIIKNYDETASAFFYTKPINFYNASSKKFEPVDSSLVKSNKDDFIFKNTKNIVQSFFDNSGKAVFEKNHYKVTVFPTDQYFSIKKPDSKINVSDDIINYYNLYDDVDLRYRVSNGVVSEEFVLNQELNVKNLTVIVEFEKPVFYKTRKDGSIGFFDNDSSKNVLIIEKPFMMEENNPLNRSKGLFYNVEKINNSSFKIKKIFTESGLKWLHDKNRSYPVVVDPTYRYYSSDVNDGFDGYVSVSGSNWLDIRNKAQGSVSNSSAEYNDTAISASNNTIFSISRSFFAFNTSNLSSDAIINSASLYLYGYGNNESSVMAQNWNDGSNGLSVDDYSAIDLNGGSYGNTSDWIIDDYNQIIFNSLGLNNINKDSFTYLACREYEHDFSNITPSSSNSNGVYFSDWTGGSTRYPYLQIDFTLDTTNPSTNINYPNNVDYLNNLKNITGSASDNIKVENVTIQIKNNTNDTYWAYINNGWSWYSLQQLDSFGGSPWFNVTPEDGSWGETNENWYYNCSNDNINWSNNSYYTISAKARDGTNTDISEDSEDFWYDNQNPSSYVETITPYVQTSSPITVNASASDTGSNASGIKNVTLWYRYSNDNQTWTVWTDYSTDSSSPWEWSFNFPNGDGYYEFYSISFDNAFNIETKNSNDTICRYNSKIPPVINNFNLKNNTGSKIDNATGLLDINKKYYFEINITDENGWGNIGYVNITSWFDGGNENSFYNQTLGGNLNMFLQYKNTTGSAEFKMLWPDNEAELITNDCSETIISPKTRIIQIYFKPKNQVRWAESNKTWATTNNICNDIYSWNFNITVSDQEDLKDYVIGEYGVDRFTYIEQVKKLLYVTVIPGYDGDTNTVSMNFSSNYDYKIILYFEKNLINSTSGLDIEIKDNVDILADADEDDDILTDQTFNGIGENNAIEVINSSGVFSSDGFLQSINFRFNVDVPLGTYSGKYNSRIATKITQK